MFKECCDDKSISEGTAVLLLSQFLDVNAESNWKYYFNHGSPCLGGFRTYPEALNHLSRTNAKDIYISKGIPVLEKTRQGVEEDDLDFSTCLRDKARACGKVFSETELMSKFLIAVHPDIKPILLATRLDGEMPFENYVERALAQGDAHRALVKRLFIPRKSRSINRLKSLWKWRAQTLCFNKDRMSSQSAQQEMLSRPPSRGEATYSAIRNSRTRPHTTR